MVESPLIQLLESKAIPIEERRGGLVALAFDDASIEMQAARGSAALSLLPTPSRIVVTGRHRGRFLHNMTTCQIKELQAGHGNFGLIVNGGGKIVAQFFIEAEEERLILEMRRAREEDALAQLKRYIVADDVTFTSGESSTLLALVGPASDGIIEALCPGRPEVGDYGFFDQEIAGVSCRIRKNALRLDLPGWDIQVGPEGSARVWEALTEAGAAPLGFNAWEILRIESGWPVDGVDMGDENIPLESDRLAATIDWDKGCYIGQEVIAMMHYRGKPNKHLTQILFAKPPATAEVGAALTNADGKVVGRLGTRVDSPTLGTVALGVIKRRHAADGSAVLAPCGSEGRVKRLPVFVAE